MPEIVHTYVRKLGPTADDPVELHYSASGRALQRDTATLSEAGLPKPDLMRGRLTLPSLDDAVRALRLGLHGVFTRETTVEDVSIYQERPELLGPPKIQLRPPRVGRPE